MTFACLLMQGSATLSRPVTRGKLSDGPAAIQKVLSSGAAANSGTGDFGEWREGSPLVKHLEIWEDGMDAWIHSFEAEIRKKQTSMKLRKLNSNLCF